VIKPFVNVDNHTSGSPAKLLSTLRSELRWVECHAIWISKAPGSSVTDRKLKRETGQNELLQDIPLFDA
jgi:hypothetical protein